MWERLEGDRDAWVSTASPDGVPCLVPLSFVWHDGALLLSTRATTPTARNLRRSPECRIALGYTRDVVLIDGRAEVIASDALPVDAGTAFARTLGWDPRGRRPWVFLRVRPRRVRAWREENELAEREVMRDGEWVV